MTFSPLSRSFGCACACACTSAACFHHRRFVYSYSDAATCSVFGLHDARLAGYDLASVSGWLRGADCEERFEQVNDLSTR
jgi:hypothetical protein